jgi:hypothetical protein
MVNETNKSLIKTIIFIILFSLIFPQNLTFSQTIQTFTKNDWSNPSDFATSSNINFGPDLKIISISSSTTHTSDIDFQNGTFNTTTVREKGSGSDAKVELEISEIGENWVLAPLSFSGRYGHASVFWKDKIWILGGLTAEGAKNDVWYYSTTTNSATLVTSSAPWLPRYGHAAFTFDVDNDNEDELCMGGGKIKNFDGTDFDGADLWCTKDGINWVKIVESTTPVGRYFFSFTFFDSDNNGKKEIWVSGGKLYTAGFEWPANDVHYSEDLINWTEATSSANWSPRYGHTMIAFDSDNDGQEELWIFGGYDDNNYFNDIWFSTDGINWTFRGNAIWDPRYGHTAIVANNAIWLIGGKTSTGVSDELWVSSNGINWFSQGKSSDFRKYFHASIFHDDKIWSIGGYDDNVYKNTISYYNIMVTDRRELIPGAPWGPRGWMSTFVFRDKIWLIGGVGDELKNDIWVSSDGINWELVTSSTPWSPRITAFTVFQDKIWMFGGGDVDNNFHDDVWVSEDGINWTKVLENAPWGKRFTSVTTFDNKIYLLGGYEFTGNLDNPFVLKNDVWYSLDGINWTLATDTAPWSERFFHSAFVFDNKVWITGGWAGTDVWYSSDGINWTLATDTLPAFNFTVFDNKIWALGPGSSSLKNNLWYYQNGVDWILATTTELLSGRLFFGFITFDNKIWVLGGEDSSTHKRNDIWYIYPVYENQGLYISPKIDLTVSPNFSTLQFNIQKPTSTDIKFQLSSSQNDITWTDFLGPDGTTSTFYTTSGQTINPIHTGHRYIRYKAILETTNNTLTPSLNDITINYQYFPTSSFLISNPIDTNKENTQFLTLTYDEITPTGTQIIVYLRTANNLSDLNSAEWHSYSSTNPKCNKSGNTVTCDLTNPLPPGRYIQYKIEMTSDELNTPIFDNLALTYNIGEMIISQEAPRQIISITGGSSVSQVKYLLQNKQYDLARKIILEYPHLFKRDYLLREYPNLFTQEELNFISSVLGEYKIEQLIPLLSQISQQQEQKQQTVQISKYQHLKEKLQQHPLKNELKNFRFKKVLKEGMRNKDVKYLQIILNLDNDTKLRDKGPGSFTKETEYFGYFTKQAVIKFQEKYKEDILKPINKDKGTGIVGIMTIMKLNEILEEITK